MSPRGTDVGHLVPDFDDMSYPLLRLVDPYGDTYFSSYQMAGLLPEIRRLEEEHADEALAQLASLAEQCRESSGTFLVFIGD
jgi:hypothetical protein